MYGLGQLEKNAKLKPLGQDKFSSLQSLIKKLYKKEAIQKGMLQQPRIKKLEGKFPEDDSLDTHSKNTSRPLRVHSYAIKPNFSLVKEEDKSDSSGGEYETRQRSLTLTGSN